MEHVEREGQDWKLFLVVLGSKGAWVRVESLAAETLEAASLQKEMVGNTANLVGERNKLQPAIVAGGSVTVPSVLCLALMCLEFQALLSQQLLS